MDLVTVHATPTRRNVEGDAVREWLIAKKSPNTRKAYSRDFSQFARFIDGLGIDIDEVQPKHVNAWARTMTEEGASAATVNRRLSTVSSFFASLVLDGKRETNPANAERVERETSTGGKHAAALDTKEIKSLFTAAADASVRDHLVIQILALTGMRVSELCNADVGHVSIQKGHCVVTVRGKGNKTRQVPLPASVCAHLDWQSRPTDEPLVKDNDGERLNRHQVSRILARLQRAAGIGTKITPHVLRATCITESLDAGVELWIVQDLVGHSDSRTTRAYQRRSAALEKSPTFVLAGRWAD